MPLADTPLGRLQAYWVYGGAIAGLLLLVLTPLFAQDWSRGDVLTFLTLPAYMLHQWEEHDADRFRRFFNAEIGQGREVLTTADVFLINIPGVWGVLAVAIWLGQTLAPGWGLIGPALILVNALAHAGQAVAMRRPNPGLWSALLVFVPLGILGCWTLWPQASVAQGAVALALAIALHAVILIRVRTAAGKAAR